MIGRDAILADGVTVFLCGVTLVREPVVLGVFPCQLVHVVITIGLGLDACSSNGKIFPVTLHDGGMGEVLVGLELIAIHNDRLWTHLELV